MVDQITILRRALSALNLKLLDTQWEGWNARYRFRCRRKHEASVTANHAVYSLLMCPGCRNEALLAAIHELARRRGGRCLDTEYAGRTVRYRFVCHNGHAFEKTAVNLQKGSWCVPCSHAEHALRMTDPTGLKRLRAVAKQRGGRCLSDTYTKSSDRYVFRCAQGHEWTAAGAEVLGGAWCGLCANARKSLDYRRRDGLRAMREHARQHGGKCLATEYTGSKSRYVFRCAHGHEWSTLAARIFRGAWCPACQNKGNVYDIADMRRIARERGGRCLSRTYVNSATQLEWACSNGHRWSATPSSIIQGSWCRTCRYEGRKLGIGLMQEIAAERGGQCISTAYVNSSTRLEWECHIGHRWLATPNSVRNGHWCRLCAYLAMTTDPRTIRKGRHLPARG